MYRQTPWNYIQKKNELNRSEQDASNFKIAHSKWLQEGNKLVVILEEELKKDQPDLSQVRKIAESIAKHMKKGANIGK